MASLEPLVNYTPQRQQIDEPMTMNPERLKVAQNTIFVAAAALVGYTAWGADRYIQIAMLMPMLWLLAPSRIVAYLTACAYYLAGSRVIPSAAGVFFGNTNSYSVGVALWLSAAMLNAAPWGLAWADKNRCGTASIVGRTWVALAVSLVPPLALIGWLNPLIATATILPGGGFYSIGGAFVLFAVLAASLRQRKWALIFCVLIVTLWLAITANTSKPLEPPADWKAVNLNAGPFPHTPAEKFTRNRLLLDETVAAIDEGKTVIIFPEQIAGWWGDLSTQSMLQAALNSRPNASPTIVVGAEVIHQNGVSNTNSLVFMEKGEMNILDSRQSVPIALWKPWTQRSTPANWWATGIVKLDGRPTLFSFCYEDFIPTLPLLSFIVGNPEIIVSVSNAWWVRGTDEVELQEQHIRAVARIFGVPILRSVNRG